MKIWRNGPPAGGHGARPLLTTSQIAGARFSSGEGGPFPRRQGLSPSGRRAGAEPRRGGNSKASGGG